MGKGRPVVCLTTGKRYPALRQAMTEAKIEEFSFAVHMSTGYKNGNYCLEAQNGTLWCWAEVEEEARRQMETGQILRPGFQPQPLAQFKIKTPVRTFLRSEWKLIRESKDKNERNPLKIMNRDGDVTYTDWEHYR